MAIQTGKLPLVEKQKPEVNVTWRQGEMTPALKKLMMELLFVPKKGNENGTN